MTLELIRASLRAKHNQIKTLSGRRRELVARDNIQRAWNPGGNVAKGVVNRGSTWIPMDEIFSEIPLDASEIAVATHLRAHRSPGLRACLRVAFDDSVVVLFKTYPTKWEENPAPLGFSDSTLAQEYKIMRYFITPEYEKLGEKRAYDLLNRRLEAISGEEGRLLISVLKKELNIKFPAVTKKAVMMAFPDLIDPSKQKDALK